MKSLVVDQCQLESAPIIQLKPGVFKTDHGAVDATHGSPEESNSECSESAAIKSAKVMSDPQHSSVPSSEQSRPSSEVEVEVVTAASQEESGSRSNRNSSGRHHHRSAKRKYEELASVPTTVENAMVGLDTNQHHSADNSNSNESVPIQDQQHHPDTLTDHHSEADVARWKRLYSSAMENDTLQVN